MKFTSHQFAKAGMTLEPAVYSAASTDGANVDKGTHREAIVSLLVGAAVGAGTVDVKLQEADDDGAGAPDTYADIVGAVFAQVAAANDHALFVGSLDLTQRKRWLRAVAVGDGANGVNVACQVTLLDAQYQPNAPTLSFNVR